jgi:hypothetical protein
MATKSITKQVVISDKLSGNRLATALERAAEFQIKRKHPISISSSSQTIVGASIRKLFTPEESDSFSQVVREADKRLNAAP